VAGNEELMAGDEEGRKKSEGLVFCRFMKEQEDLPVR
jgi:hypothetical protein